MMSHKETLMPLEDKTPTKVTKKRKTATVKDSAFNALSSEQKTIQLTNKNII